MLLSSLFILSGCQIIEDGETGVSISLGKISDEGLKPGWYISIPRLREVENWNIKTQRLTKRMNIESAEKLVVGMEVNVLYRSKEPVKIRKNIGKDYRQAVLEPTLTDVMREVVVKEGVENIVRDQEKLTEKTENLLRAKLGDRGVELEELLVTAVVLPPKFREAVERKLQSEQKALEKQFELQQAKKDAEIEIARAEGAAKAQEIVRRTLSAEYLQYLWISTLNENPT